MATDPADWAARNDLPLALGALEAVLRGHDDRPVFLAAEDCECVKAPAGSPAWPAWEADHPYGEGDAGRICVLTEIGRYCPACTELVYEDAADADSYVDASACIVRPVITKALTGEASTDGN